MRFRSCRSGYAMMLVIVFIAVVNLFFALSYKHFSAALRVQKANALARDRDEGNVLALAAGLALLELELPTKDATNRYRYTIVIGEHTHSVEYEVLAGPVGEEGETQTWYWSVTASIDDLAEPRDLPTAINDALDSIPES